MRRLFALIGLVTTLVGGNAACSRGSKGIGNEVTLPGTKIQVTTNSAVTQSPMDASAIKTNPTQDTETCKPAFLLQGEPKFERAFDVLADYCLACHNTDLTPGGDFASQATLKEIGAKIKARINLDANDPGLMPPQNKLSDEQIADITAWIDAGAPLPVPAETPPSSGKTNAPGGSTGDPLSNTLEMPTILADCLDTKGDKPQPEQPKTDNDQNDASDDSSWDENTASNTSTMTSTNTGTTTSTTTNTSTQTDQTTGSDLIPDALKLFVEPEAKLLCHDQGRPFFRKTDADNLYGICDTSAGHPAPFACTYDGALKAFNNSQTVKAFLDNKVAKGWYFDDCGVIDNRPVVYFACYTKGDNLCVKISEIAADRLKILGERLTISP